MFHEVPQQEVTTTSRQSGAFDVFGGERSGEALEQPNTLLERVEHFPMTGRVRSSSFDDVVTVGSMSTDSVDVLVGTREFGRESIAEFAGDVVRQLVRVGAEVDPYVVSVLRNADGRFVTGEFLDQECESSAS